MTENRLTSISPSSAFTHGALVAFFLAYPLVALMRFLQHFDGPVGIRSPWWVAWAMMPIGFALASAVWAMLASLAYNGVARLLGGIKYNG